MPEGRELQLLAVSAATHVVRLHGNGRFHACARGGSHFALVSTPSPDPPHFRTFQSRQRRERLYQSGVCFVTWPRACRKRPIFLNAAGEIGLGLNRYDAVIPPAAATPIMPVGLSGEKA